jgi:CO/xanthine dehydrogenase FAD-binding subunit
VRVVTPKSLDEALDLLATAAEPLTPIAGGTDLLVSWHHQVKDRLNLLDLSRLNGQLRSFRLTDTALELGALTTYWDVISAPEIATAFPLLPETARQIGAVQIQTRGTWAGNIGNGSPAADGVAALMAYDASVVLQSRHDQCEVPLEQFYTGYRQSVRRRDQLIVAVRLPRRPRQCEWFHKVGARGAQAISKVAVAVVKDEQGWRVVVASAAPVVRRCRRIEQALEGGQSFATPSEIAQILSTDIAPINDIRSTARYRATVLSRLLYHWLQESTT